MKMRLLVSVATVALGAASGALAQSATSGWYVGADVGYHESKDVKATSTNNYQWNFGGEHDWAAFGRLGYKFTPNWRVEAEYGFRPNDLKTVRGAGLAGVDGTGTGQPIGLCTPGVGRSPSAPDCGEIDGKMKATTLMANVLFDMAPNSSLNPFIGAGVGTAWVHNKAYGQLSGVPTGAARFQNTNFDDVDQAFAMQGIVGLGWNFAPNWSMDLTGRYLRTSKLDWGSVTQNAGPAGGSITDVGTFSGRYKDTSVTLGLRYTFGAPPPPPPAAPAYESREFVVYFPFDQYVLTPEAQAVVQQAADYAKGGGATKIVVTGHTDTSGSDAYNRRLSERRAKAVADGLVGMGVNATALAVDWKGESAPAVATGDGVKEPLNRRSTVSINF
ncbi:OmpA family protein [Caulobacter segnis]|uniref:OmpA/MotB domain protein n=1 Tax=Caulobacter segnis (strain ATCC 21756 / DSM 7131 / JCM 7823 / NBRC 15250 / LMG 17158 / TK0059) TaxID=509190 RepID=D5VNG7_CAUST|nr:OmpA family protein [Caulobacter segnis]ADG12040.1 OmpA/MotB domain protein [Caulobacter segnis ATCC 21756]